MNLSPAALALDTALVAYGRAATKIEREEALRTVRSAQAQVEAEKASAAFAAKYK